MADHARMERTRRSRGQLLVREYGYLIRVFMGRDTRGRRQYHNEQFRGSKRDAARRLTTLLHELDGEVFVPPTKMRFSEWVDEWLDNKVKLRASPRTLKGYRGYLERYALPQLGTRPLSKITRADLQKVYAAMHDRGLSPRTIRHCQAVLHLVFEEAFADNLLARNPAKGIRLAEPRAEEKPNALTAVELRRFLAEARKASRHYSLFLLAAVTGMRPGELAALKWEDVDLLSGQLVVRRALSANREIRKPKNNKVRSIPLGPAITAELKLHRERQRFERKSFSPEYADLDLVFPCRNGGPLNLGNLASREVKQLARAASLPGWFHMYSLRHTCATYLLSSGENLKTVQERLGHSDGQLTLNTYIHAVPGLQELASVKIESWVLGVNE